MEHPWSSRAAPRNASERVSCGSPPRRNRGESTSGRGFRTSLAPSADRLQRRRTPQSASSRPCLTALVGDVENQASSLDLSRRRREDRHAADDRLVPEGHGDLAELALARGLRAERGVLGARGDVGRRRAVVGDRDVGVGVREDRELQALGAVADLQQRDARVRAVRDPRDEAVDLLAAAVVA
jgi:hypothetical protein